jgi:hypothetical protein
MPGRSVSRTVWDSLENPQERILLDVVEEMPTAAVLKAIADRLQKNQLARLAEGPIGCLLAYRYH